MSDVIEADHPGDPCPPVEMPQPPPLPPPLPLSTLIPVRAGVWPVVEQHRGYLIRHWRGELPLAVSYWVNSVLLGVLLRLPVYAVEKEVLDADEPRPYILAEVVLCLLIPLIFVWQAGGVIRSARRFRRDTGFRFLPYCAVGLMVLGGVVNVRVVGKEAAIIPDEIKWVVKADPYGDYTVQVSQDGRDILVKGGMGFGLPAELRKALRQHPQADTVVFDSLGGRVHSGLMIGTMLSEGRYKTRVDRICASACAIAFLGGTDRLIDVRGKLGFHHPKFLEALDQSIENKAIEREKAFIWSRGVSSSFVDRIYATAFADIYVPGIDELAAAHVVTGVVDRGETISLDDYHARHAH